MELRESEEIFIYPGVARARGGTSLCEMVMRDEMHNLHIFLNKAWIDDGQKRATPRQNQSISFHLLAGVGGPPLNRAVLFLGAAHPILPTLSIQPSTRLLVLSVTTSSSSAASSRCGVDCCCR